MDPSFHFKRYLLYSISFHALLLILFLVLFEERPAPKLQKTQITMVRLTPRLGTRHGVPEAPPRIPEAKKVEPTKPPEAPPAPKVVTPPKPVSPPKPPSKKPVEKTTPPDANKIRIAKPKTQPTAPKPKTKQTQAPDQQKLDQALAGIQKELQERETTTSPSSGTSTGVPALGSPQGSVSARDPIFARYQSQVRSKIIRNWVKTHTSGSEEVFRARILVRINASGSVIAKTLSRRSGNASFDNSALRAVELASPLPPPPDLVRDEALREGFIVDFNSRVLGR